MEKTNPDSVIKNSLTTPVRQNSRQTENDQPILLSLNLGTATGWALSNKHGRIMSSTAHFRPRRFEGGGMRYLRFERWLNETRDVSGEINVVYFEEVRRHLGVDAAHAYGGFLASLTTWCEEHSIPYEGVPVGTIKKFIYNLGGGALQRSTLRRKINREEHGEVPEQLMRWVWAGGCKLKGLVRRRTAEAGLYTV